MKKTYDGSCHCGAYKFAVELDLEANGVMTCNCSICARAGYMLAFVPPEQLDAKTDESALKDYRFNKHVISHLFCTTCGIHPIGRGKGQDGKAMAMVNVRCLDGIESLGALKVTQWNGRAA